MPTLVVADDHSQVRTLIRLLLEQAGYVVFEAASGVEALAHCRRTPVDVLLLDRIMPGLDGLRTAARFAEEFPTAPTRVLLLSGDECVVGAETSSLPTGIHRIIRKPFDVTQFLEMVREEIARIPGHPTPYVPTASAHPESRS